jgi:hypothetical protein
MQVLQTVKQNVELGTVLEASVASVVGALNKGMSTVSPALELTVGGHAYSVTVSFALVA